MTVSDQRQDEKCAVQQRGITQRCPEIREFAEKLREIVVNSPHFAGGERMLGTQPGDAPYQGSKHYNPSPSLNEFLKNTFHEVFKFISIIPELCSRNCAGDTIFAFQSYGKSPNKGS